jgi:micrococcal nuclease
MTIGILLALALFGGPPRPAPDAGCEVGRIVDGDTFYCRDGRKVRLIGIDSPEIPQGRPGRDAREVLRRLIPEGTMVRLEGDVAPRDRWGRTLAYAWAGNRLVNEAMVLAGWAVRYTVPPNVKYDRRLERAQNEARTRRSGLWGSGGFECLPADYRRRGCVSRPEPTRVPGAPAADR